ncbi:dynactin 62 kDa subunit [Tieghemostelium lacteum]|uniref:Dynactin subunit 4 n=1 Tax=Tieghemostelium lacteum TaxID=361077 RepID=A0A152A0N5_TIELA|nr:dynactin 62 kDa subunit [Tieghemostelium lacteum]|eukprot:KYQ99676.1 dynactin 62 kDa subunit [Tieghemostelium lacteum]
MTSLNVSVASRYQNSTIFNSNSVNANNQIIKYGCSCGKAFHLTEEYYCGGCQKINCKYCISEEIDGYYCPNCLEYISNAEAQLSGNRCKKCFECPVCFNILTYSIHTPSGQTEDSSSTIPENYFLNCGFCKWNSFGNSQLNSKLLTILNSPSVMTGSSQSAFTSSTGVSSPGTTQNQQPNINRVLEALNKESTELNSLKDKKAISRMKMAHAMKQFLVQEQKHQKSNQRKNFIKIEDKWQSNSIPHPMPSNDLIPNIINNPVTNNNLLSVQTIKKTIKTPVSYQDSDAMQLGRVQSRVFPEVIDNQAFQDDEIPFGMYSLKDTDEITGLDQRFRQIQIGGAPGGNSSGGLDHLVPQHKYLLTRRSKRCKRCDRLLMKPDIKPDKTEFKRQHFAFSLVPRVTVQKCLWTDLDMFELFLTITNPQHSHMFIYFPQKAKTSFSSVDDNSQPIDILPTETFVNGLLDEIDDQDKEVYIQQLKIKDSTRYIVERKDNKLILRLFVKVVPSALMLDQTILTVTEQSITPSELVSTNSPRTTTAVQLEKYPSTFPSIKFTLLMEFSMKPNQLSNSLSTDSSSSATINVTPQSTATPTMATSTVSTFSSSNITSPTSVPTTPSSNITPLNSSTAGDHQHNTLKILFDIPANKFENTL